MHLQLHIQGDVSKEIRDHLASELARAERSEITAAQAVEAMQVGVLVCVLCPDVCLFVNALTTIDPVKLTALVCPVCLLVLIQSAKEGEAAARAEVAVMRAVLADKDMQVRVFVWLFLL